VLRVDGHGLATLLAGLRILVLTAATGSVGVNLDDRALITGRWAVKTLGFGMQI